MPVQWLCWICSGSKWNHVETLQVTTSTSWKCATRYLAQTCSEKHIYFLSSFSFMFASILTLPLQRRWKGYTGFTLAVRLSGRRSFWARNDIRSVSPTILARSILCWHILPTILRRCIACCLSFWFWNVDFWRFFSSAWWTTVSFLLMTLTYGHPMTLTLGCVYFSPNGDITDFINLI